MENIQSQNKILPRIHSLISSMMRLMIVGVLLEVFIVIIGSVTWPRSIPNSISKVSPESREPENWQWARVQSWGGIRVFYSPILFWIQPSAEEYARVESEFFAWFDLRSAVEGIVDSPSREAENPDLSWKRLFAENPWINATPRPTLPNLKNQFTIIESAMGWPSLAFYSQTSLNDCLKARSIQYANGTLILPHEPSSQSELLQIRIIPLQPLWQGLLIDALLLGTVISLIQFSVSLTRCKWRQIHNKCYFCGYDLRGLTRSACPECGTANAIRFRKKLWDRGVPVISTVVVVTIIELILFVFAPRTSPLLLSGYQAETLLSKDDAVKFAFDAVQHFKDPPDATIVVTPHYYGYYVLLGWSSKIHEVDTPQVMVLLDYEGKVWDIQ